MSRYTYRVEWLDDDCKEFAVPYGTRREAAISKARRESIKNTVAYVVALQSRFPDDGTSITVGSKSYGMGSIMETEGEGFN